MHWRTYLYFAIFNLAFVPVIYFFYPETKNLSLEQIDLLFTGEKVLMHLPPGMAATGGVETAVRDMAGSEKSEGVAVVEDVRVAGADKI